MSTTGTDADDIPTDTTLEYEGEYLYEDEQELEEEEIYQLDTNDFISGPYLSETCTVPYDILEHDYSYGYDCKKLFNLVAPDAKTIIFIGGNLIHFFDVATGKLNFRRSYLGGGLGHITVNPNSMYPHLAVAENGDNPPIMIYEWPSLEIVGILKEGAAKRYAHINYSPDGQMLVSQSSAPDYLITVWQWQKWRRSPIVLRTKSHVTDVYKCMFSPYVPGHITTAGSGHIKFWKMAQTFTGLKLQGELGRFGKTEISDIVGMFPMPDEKVVSGSEWGNLLVWEAGLIKLEVTRTMRRRCHEGPVLQLEFVRAKGEIWSVSRDGWLRAWEYRVIDEADPPDEDRVVQMMPSYEREIPNVHFSCICKKFIYEPENMLYYAQDSNGGIWEVDLVLRGDFQPARRLLACHAGHVTDLEPCPWGPYLASIGDSGHMFVYNYLERTQTLQYEFLARGRKLIWLPMKIDISGSFLLAGFDDGVVRLLNINFQNKCTLQIVQSIKPHNKPITTMALNEPGNIFVTGGEDSTIFIFELRKRAADFQLQPIGFVSLAAIPTCFTWHPHKATILLVGCNHGQLLEFDLPCQPVPYTKISYHLHTIKPVRQRFTTCKAQIRRDLYLKEVEERKAGKLARKKKEIEQIKEANPGLEVDEELYLQDSESEEILEPLHIPEVPNQIFFTQYTAEDTIWLSMGGYDAGYIYEYHMDQKHHEPLKATIIADGDDIEMHGYIYSPDGEYIFTSMQNGSIRINRINPENFRDLSDYWLLTMHDNFRGRITKMCFSYDNKYFFSAGEDGNIFSYIYHPGVEFYTPRFRRPTTFIPVRGITIDENYDSLSLEETMIKAEQDKQMRLANEHKRRLRLRLKELTSKLTSLLDRNCRLPTSQRYPLRTFVVDHRIMDALNNMLEDKVNLEIRKLAYDVEKSTIALTKLKKHYTDVLDYYPITVKAINTNTSVSVVIIRGLRDRFFSVFSKVKRKAAEEKLKGRLPPRNEIHRESKFDLRPKVQEVEPFLVGLSPTTIAHQLGCKLTRLLNKYRERKHQRERRQEDWARLFDQKPVEGVNHPDDERAVKIATETIGDFKLKTSSNYKVPNLQRETTVTKYQELLEARLRACKYMVRMFNSKVIAIRDKKIRIIDQLTYLTNRLGVIHEEMPEGRIKKPPPIPVVTPEDFPEREIEVQLTVESNFEAYLNRDKPRKREDPKCDIRWERDNLGCDHLPDFPGTTQDIVMHFAQQPEVPFSPFKNKIPNVHDTKDTFWDKELKYRRLIRRIHEQETIIQKMNTMVLEFDKEVKALSLERFSVQVCFTVLELYILTLNQELIIVKDFETVEEGLSAIAMQKWTEMMDMRDNMQRIENAIDVHNYSIETCNEQIKGIQQTFLTAAKDNKFWDFLRRIFKKKYRPPKLATDESDSSSVSSSSSSDSEEDDAGSLDSRDIGPIRLDESICPKGCDKELYDYTFNLRGRRHELEKQIGEEKRAIDECRKDLIQAGKKMKIYDQANKKAQDELEKYQALKQKTLNEVNVLVCVRLNQMRHLNPDGYSVAKLQDTLIFTTDRLQRLYQRVNELQMETLEERTKHMKNKIHLHRMNVDCRSMNKTIAEMKKQITEKMIIKFGSRVKIDDIEEAILKRMVLNLRIKMLNLGAAYEKAIDKLRKEYGEKQDIVKTVIRENTARLDVLALLNKEKVRLARLLDIQARTKEKAKQADDQSFLKDINKLEAVTKSQQDQIRMLKLEIKMLSTKTLPPKPIVHVAPKIPVEEPHPVVGDYGSLDELYESPELPEKLVTVLPSIEDQEVTEEEIVLCIHELMKEVVDTVVDADTEDTEEKMVIKILTEIIEQVPMYYLEKGTSLEYIGGLIKDIVSDVTKMNSKTVIESISNRTNKSSEEISNLFDNIILQMLDDDDFSEGSRRELD